MKNSFVILCSYLLPILSLDIVTPKFCVHCKFFRNNFMGDNKFGKCSLFPVKEGSIHYFVTGIEKDADFNFCSTARKYDDMCGKDGKKYTPKDT
jgi:hypothetical protein